MRKSKFTDSQIMDAVKRVDGETIGNLNIPAVLKYRVKTSHLLQMASQIWRHGRFNDFPHE
jgi:hypothetical protein